MRLDGIEVRSPNGPDTARFNPRSVLVRTYYTPVARLFRCANGEEPPRRSRALRIRFVWVGPARTRGAVRLLRSNGIAGAQRGACARSTEGQYAIPCKRARGRAHHCTLERSNVPPLESVAPPMHPSYHGMMTLVTTARMNGQARGLIGAGPFGEYANALKRRSAFLIAGHGNRRAAIERRSTARTIVHPRRVPRAIADDERGNRASRRRTPLSTKSRFRWPACAASSTALSGFTADCARCSTAPARRSSPRSRASTPTYT